MHIHKVEYYPALNKETSGMVTHIWKAEAGSSQI